MGGWSDLDGFRGAGADARGSYGFFWTVIDRDGRGDYGNVCWMVDSRWVNCWPQRRKCTADFVIFHRLTIWRGGNVSGLW